MSWSPPIAAKEYWLQISHAGIRISAVRAVISSMRLSPHLLAADTLLERYCGCCSFRWIQVVLPRKPPLKQGSHPKSENMRRSVEILHVSTRLGIGIGRTNLLGTSLSASFQVSSSKKPECTSRMPTQRNATWGKPRTPRQTASFFRTVGRTYLRS